MSWWDHWSDWRGSDSNSSWSWDWGGGGGHGSSSSSSWAPKVKAARWEGWGGGGGGKGKDEGKDKGKDNGKDKGGKRRVPGASRHVSEGALRRNYQRFAQMRYEKNYADHARDRPGTPFNVHSFVRQEISADVYAKSHAEKAKAADPAATKPVQLKPEVIDRVRRQVVHYHYAHNAADKTVQLPFKHFWWYSFKQTLLMQGPPPLAHTNFLTFAPPARPPAHLLLHVLCLYVCTCVRVDVCVRVCTCVPACTLVQ